MKSAIHQPNTFPWTGYFIKLLWSDTFILLDDVQYTKNDYINRVKMNSSSGWWWLTVPVFVKNRFGQHINEVEINNSGNWQKKIVQRVEQEYKKAPFFAGCFDAFKEAAEYKSRFLAEYNLYGLGILLKLLGMKVKIIKSSSLDVKETKNLRIIGILKKVDAEKYLSGSGAAAYTDETLFARENIKLVYSQSSPRPYAQIHSAGFVPGLSIWDLLFNLGVEGTKNYLEREVDRL